MYPFFFLSDIYYSFGARAKSVRKNGGVYGVFSEDYLSEKYDVHIKRAQKIGLDLYFIHRDVRFFVFLDDRGSLVYPACCRPFTNMWI